MAGATGGGGSINCWLLFYGLERAGEERDKLR